MSPVKEASAVDGGRRVTSADVARLAGVSRATVSYVLNDTPRQSISAGTRTRVLDAAARLGYAPSAAARTLRTGRSDVVLCLLPDWPIGSEVGSLLGSLSTALAREGLTFVVHPGNREDRPINEIWKAITPAAVLAFDDFSEAEMTAMRAAGVALVVALLGRGRRDGRAVGAVVTGHPAVGPVVTGHPAVGPVVTGHPAVDAVVTGHPAVDAVVTGHRADGAVVAVGAGIGRPPVVGAEAGGQMAVGQDVNGAAVYGVDVHGRELETPQELIGRRQAEHLVAAGHTCLGYAAPDDERLQIFAEPRLAGVRAACRSAGIEDPAIEMVALDPTQATSAVRRLLAHGVTAICAYNDEVALAVLAGARAVDLVAPTGLAVIGVDDIPAARLAAPALTTITTDQTAIAAHLVATVVAAVGGQPAPALPVADLVRVIVRDSA